MKVYINNKACLFDFCSVTLNRYSFSQFFELQDVNHLYTIGDKILITHDNGEKLIEGEIEYLKVSDSLSIYKGRNDMKALVDNNFADTKQFSANTKISNILRDICNPYNINVSGDAEGFQNTSIVCHVGENISLKIRDICQWGGADISFGIDNTIYINKNNQDINTDFEFVYGGTITNREYIIDTINSYSNYTVHSLYNKASYGSGEKKVLCYDIDLSQSDCWRSAYNAFKKNQKSLVSYSCYIPGEKYVIINNNYIVKDLTLGIEAPMMLKYVVYEQSSEKYTTRCVLEPNVN